MNFSQPTYSTKVTQRTASLRVKHPGGDGRDFAINLSCKAELLALRAFEKTDALYYGFFDFVHLSNSTSIVLELAQLMQHATKKSLKL